MVSSCRFPPLEKGRQGGGGCGRSPGHPRDDASPAPSALSEDSASPWHSAINRILDVEKNAVTCKRRSSADGERERIELYMGRIGSFPFVNPIADVEEERSSSRWSISSLSN